MRSGCTHTCSGLWHPGKEANPPKQLIRTGLSVKHPHVRIWFRFRGDICVVSSKILKRRLHWLRGDKLGCSIDSMGTETNSAVPMTPWGRRQTRPFHWLHGDGDKLGWTIDSMGTETTSAVPMTPWGRRQARPFHWLHGTNSVVPLSPWGQRPRSPNFFSHI